MYACSGLKVTNTTLLMGMENNFQQDFGDMVNGQIILLVVLVLGVTFHVNITGHTNPALRCGGLYYVQFVNENAINWI